MKPEDYGIGKREFLLTKSAASDEFVCEDGCYWSNFLRYFFLEELGFCGCSDETVLGDFLEIIWEMGSGDGCCYYKNFLINDPDKYKEVLLAGLETAGYVDHGTAIRGSWLTQKGKDFFRKVFKHPNLLEK